MKHGRGTGLPSPLQKPRLSSRSSTWPWSATTSLLPSGLICGPFSRPLSSSRLISLGREIDQHLHQLLFQVLGDAGDARDHLPGQVLEVLGHHDVHQVGLGGGAPRAKHRAIWRRCARPARASRRCRRRPPAAPARNRSSAELSSMPSCSGLAVGGVQHALGGLFRQARHVVETVARIGDVAGGFFDQLVQAQPAQALVQRARHVADPAQDLVMRGPSRRCARSSQAGLFHFSKILFSFSSSVAAVNGLTT
jgi:hypothetical protein